MERELEQLYIKFLNGQCSRKELQDLLDHFDQHGYDSPLASSIRAELEHESVLSDELQERVDALISDTDKDFHPWIAPPKVMRMYPWRRIAAAVLLICGLVSLYWIAVWDKTGQRGDNQISAQPVFEDIEPGGNRAILRLSDGRSYDLIEGESMLRIGADGYFYADGTAVVEGVETHNAVLVTPRGGQYSLQLPDGSMVWLNAETTLEYPMSFGQGSRQVILKGEAYFEISHDPSKPFIVQNEGQEIKVLGTKFAVRNYTGDATLTTLLQGKVQVDLPNKRRVLLKPGQQLTYTGPGAHVRDGQGDAYIGWKDNMFIFHHTPLWEALAELSRWYDIDVSYAEFPNLNIYAEIHKNTKLSVALSGMEKASGLQFEIRERRLGVKK